MIIGVPKETCPGEKRVALIPANVQMLARKGHEVIVEENAGTASGYTDQAYKDAGATIESNRAKIFEKAQIVTVVQAPGANKKTGDDDLKALKKDQIIIGMMDPLAEPEIAKSYAEQGATAIAMELIPRITRAQSMDVLSSMATIAGYKSVLIAAEKSPRMFPMFMTAAGTVKPARVMIMGAGVAGLQACATAKRLGAVVEAYDIRAAAREQILSVGAKPIELDLDTGEAEGSGGYAKEQGEDFLKRQREQLGDIIAEMDVVITTAAVPGKKSPILVTKEMAEKMKPGAILIDLAAEKGGNCELTKLNEYVECGGAIIYGPENVPSSAPYHASQMYGKNVENLLNLLITKEGELNLDFEDQIIADTTIAHDNDVANDRIREMLGMEPKPAPAEEASSDDQKAEAEDA